jgi:hypothetical protein
LFELLQQVHIGRFGNAIRVPRRGHQLGESLVEHIRLAAQRLIFTGMAGKIAAIAAETSSPAAASTLVVGPAATLVATLTLEPISVKSAAAAAIRLMLRTHRTRLSPLIIRGLVTERETANEA